MQISCTQEQLNHHLDDIHILWARPKVKEVLGIADTTLYQLIKDGELAKPLKIGRRSLWRKCDVLAFIDSKAAN